MKIKKFFLLKRTVQIILSLFTIFFSEFVFAQSTITGVVNDNNGKPLANVTVTVKGKPVGTSSNSNGAFSIPASVNDVLVFSSVETQTQEVKIRNSDPVNVQLEAKVGQLSDVVVVGYGTQLKKDVTGSVVSINVSETKKYSTSDISQLLQGRAAGVEVNSDGQPGAVPSVRIRGFSTFGNAQPFYVVDGVPNVNIRDFSPNDIESITVLKDASAAAIYGANSANGVIIITTRQGRKNSEMKVDYNGYYGWDKVWQTQDVTNREEYQMLNNESRANAGLPLFPANNPADPKFVNNINTDWQKEGLKTGTRQNHNINVSGGGTNNTYNISLDYFDNAGTYVGNGPTYTRYTGRVNTSAEKGILKVGESFSYTHSHENSLTFRDDILLGGIPPLIGSLVVAIPTMPVYDNANLGGFGGSNSEFNGANSLNGIGINSILKNFVDVDRTFANFYGQLSFLKLTGQDIKFKTSVSYDKTAARDFIWQPAFFLGKFFSQDVARLRDNSRVYTNAAIENTLNYDKSIGKHSIAVLLGQSYRQGESVLRESSADGFTIPYYPEISNGATKSAKGQEFKNTLASFFGRINYSYDDRYLLSATFRRDGSSRFSPENKYGNFPSASVGWKLSNEKFWSVSKSIVSSLKLRGSYGELGNQEIGDYLYFGSINSGVVYSFDGTRVVGGLQTLIASPNIKWESKTTTNIGLDGTFLNGLLDFSAEYYNAKSSDILVNLPIPASVGYTNSNPVVNAATLRNSGMEISTTFHKSKGSFTFDVSANFSTLKNEVVGLGGNEEPIYGAGAKTEIGGIVGEHYGFVYEGIFQTQAEIDAHAKQFGATLKPGDVKYKDISGPDGKPDGIVDEAFDRTYLGSGIPKYFYGFNFSAAYKGFDLTIFMSGSADFKINSRMYRDLHHSGGALNYSTDMLKRWTPSNTNTDIPRLNDADVNNFKDSDRPGWLQSGTYLRINTVSVGYNLPHNIIKGLTKSRVYASAQNLYSFQKYKGYNPDFNSSYNSGVFNPNGVFNPGYDFGSYPKPRTIILGVQLNF